MSPLSVTPDIAPSSKPPANRQPPSPVRTLCLLVYMMRVPLLALLTIGAALPYGFRTSMLHGLADLELAQVFAVSWLATLLVSSAITACFLVLLYGEERVDGWKDRGKAEDRVAKPAVALLYIAGIGAWGVLLWSVRAFMKTSGKEFQNFNLSFLAYVLLGLLAGLALVVGLFFAALKLAKPDDDEALESFALPALFLLPRGSSIRVWLRQFKGGTCTEAAPGSFASHSGPISRLSAALGPGYGRAPVPGAPASLHSGHRFVSFVLALFALAYLFSGRTMLHQLADTTAPWAPGEPHNSVLGYVLVLLIFWMCLLSGLTFFVDRFRMPVLLALAVLLYGSAQLGSSDHVFSTVAPQRKIAQLPTPHEFLRRTAARAQGSAIFVAAAGGGIQSAAWASRVLCGLRAHAARDFQGSVAAVSGVSGGSVGAMFYLRCLEGAANDESAALHTQDSSLEAVAWGLTHPDLRRIFPGPSTNWAVADRGWALEHSLLKSAHFASTERRLAEYHRGWPAMLLNATSATTGDPVVFTNTQFPAEDFGASNYHHLRGFFAESGRDVLLETAARMSAAFPYVSPAARPNEVQPVTVQNNMTVFSHLVDGGYFDNSGIFTLSEWLKEAALDPNASRATYNQPGDAGEKQRWRERNEVFRKAPDLQRVLILQLDAFPDGPSNETSAAKKWYYQLTAPIQTMLKVRSESQLVRDSTAGQDLQARLNGAGYTTEWLLVRYDPKSIDALDSKKLPPAPDAAIPCSQDPPLSWHLTQYEKACLNAVWEDIAPAAISAVDAFLSRTEQFPKEGCREERRAPGVIARLCAPGVAAPAKE